MKRELVHEPIDSIDLRRCTDRSSRTEKSADESQSNENVLTFVFKNHNTGGGVVRPGPPRPKTPRHLPGQAAGGAFRTGLPFAAPVPAVGVGPDSHERQLVIANRGQGRGHPAALTPADPVANGLLRPPKAARPAGLRLFVEAVVVAHGRSPSVRHVDLRQPRSHRSAMMIAGPPTLQHVPPCSARFGPPSTSATPATPAPRCRTGPRRAVACADRAAPPVAWRWE